MTADRQTTTDVDFFTWNRHFHGVRKHGAPDERPVKLTPAVARIACVIAAHINNESRNAKIGHRRIADCAQVSTSTVESAVEILEAAGWLLVSRETKTSQQGGKHNGTNRYRLASPVAALQADPPVDNSDDTDRGAPISGAPLPQSAGHPCPNQRGETTNSLRTRTTYQRTSVSAADRVDSKVGEKKATSLPATWTPNRTHRKVAENVDVDALAAEFRVTMDGEKRTDWDKTFGAFIKDYLEGRAEVTFPVPADDVEVVDSTSPDPDRIAQALDWIAPALWDEGLHPDALTADERAEVVLSHDPSADPHDVARRIRVNHNVSPEHVSHDARASRFEEWWSAYPRHEKKPRARAAYAAAVQRGVSEQVLIDGALRYAQDPNRSDGQYTKLPETWLVNEGWNDDPLPVRNTSAGGRPSITEIVGSTLAAGQRLMQQYATLSLESSATTVIDTVDEDVRRIERCDSIGQLDFEETIAARERLAAGIPWQEVAGDVVKERESKLEPSVRFQRAVVERCKAMLGADEVKLRLPEYRRITEAFKSGEDVESVAAAIRESRDRIPA